MLHGLVPLINMQNYIFKHFVKAVEDRSLKFCTVLKLLTLHLKQTIAQAKCTNYSNAHVQTFVLFNGEMATASTFFQKVQLFGVDTSDCLLPETN